MRLFVFNFLKTWLDFESWGETSGMAFFEWVEIVIFRMQDINS